MKILVKKAKMQRRVPAIPNDSENEIEKESPPTHEEAAKSFERNDSRFEKEEQKIEANKRPLSEELIASMQLTTLKRFLLVFCQISFLITIP